MNDPLVSVVTPCFNGAEFIDGCVRSILEQNTSCEIIVVDDGSTDDTVERARSLAREIPVHMTVISQNNAGPAAARNAGLRQARGKYVCFLDVDDRYLPGFFASTIPFLEKEPAVIGVFCQIELVNAHRTIETWQREAMERTMPCNILLRTEVVRQIGGFPEHSAFRGRIGGEDGTFRSELHRHGKIVKLSKPLFQHRVHAGGPLDYFLDRAFFANDKIQFKEHSPEESDGSIKAAIRDYREAVQDRILGRTLDGHRRVAGAEDFRRKGPTANKAPVRHRQ
jgi:glycosyltransferase involved in cell wall biosynthesis